MTCARVGKEIWKQSNLGIPRHELDESGSYRRLSQLHYWGAKVYSTQIACIGQLQVSD